MGTLSALFSVLDGFDDAQFSRPVLLAPDAALANARRAAQSGEGLQAALAEVEAMIASARPFLRAARFDVVGLQGTGEAPPPELMQRMLRDLHVAAALVLQREGRRDEAQAHFIRAAATGAPGVEPNLWLVDLFRAQGRERDALDTLRTALGDGLDAAFALLEFANDLAADGEEETAAAAYGYAGGADASGLIHSVIAARGGAAGAAGVPGDGELEAVYRRGCDVIARDDWRGALAQFEIVAGWRPRMAAVWRLIGDLLLGGGERRVDLSPAEAAELLIRASALSDDRRQALERAASAYALAAGLDPALEALALLEAICLAGAGSHGAALASAEAAAGRQPGRAERHAILALIALLAGHEEAAAQALAAASGVDPDDPLVCRVGQELAAAGSRT